VWERVYKEWKDKGVEFVGIGLLASREKSREFVDRHKLTFPNGYDGAGRIARQYGFTYQPHWAVVNKDGQLVRSGFGPRSEDDLVSTIRSLAR
jgi:cytochrome c biogenesis protein CcmG, thiol:disulfide interchange protein DsbE